MQTVLAVLNVATVIVLIVLAYMDGRLLPSQMIKQYPPGTLIFPLIANGGIWGSIFFITPIVYIIGGHTGEWSYFDILVAAIIGLCISYIMHEFVYRDGKFPDALAGNGEIRFTGKIHFIYFGFTIAALILFYFCSQLKIDEVLVIAILLVGFSAVSNHLPLSIIQSVYRFPWCPDVLKEENTPMRILLGSMAGIMFITVLKMLL